MNSDTASSLSNAKVREILQKCSTLKEIKEGIEYELVHAHAKSQFSILGCELEPIPGEKPRESAATIIDHFENVIYSADLFKGLTKEEVRKLVEICRVEQVTIDDTLPIITKGELTRDMYFIIEGRVSAVTKDLRTRELVTGAIFGELAAFTGHPRSATVRAIVTSVLLVMPSDAMNALLEVNSEMSSKIGRVVIHRLASMLSDSERLIEVLKKENCELKEKLK